VGKDIIFLHVAEMSDLEVVGKARGRRFGAKTINEWVAKSWSNALICLPSIKILAKSWIIFNFSSSADVAWVMKSTWSLDSSPLLLKRWNPLFDPNNDIMEVVPNWVRLPGFPLALCTQLGLSWKQT